MSTGMVILNPSLKRAPSFAARSVRAVRIVIGHGSIPRPIRWLAAAALLPIPGPFDEVVLMLVAVILAVFYRGQLRGAWAQARADG
jgi:hypothetical protein